MCDAQEVYVIVRGARGVRVSVRGHDGCVCQSHVRDGCMYMCGMCGVPQGYISPRECMSVTGVCGLCVCVCGRVGCMYVCVRERESLCV